MILKNSIKLATALRTMKRSYASRNILQLKDRGMLNDIFPENSVGAIRDMLNSSPQCAYAGFDPTASSLHVGNLLVLVNLLHWQRGGHNVIALIGGATGKIGDPSGKNLERDKLASIFLEENTKGIYIDVANIFENHRKYFNNDVKKVKLGSFRILNNNEWYDKILAVDLLSDVGRYLRMGTLLSRTSVQTRLKSSAGMSLNEFSYQLFQSYDWLHLFKEYGCSFQVGGGDQLGNIMSGHELISKTCGKTVYGLTLPIITSETGDKFGKSAGNAIFLSSNKTSAFNFHQFWIRIPDSDVERMLKLFTFDSIGFIEDLISKHKKQPEHRMAQKYLAEKVTLLVHGETGLKQAQDASRALYEGDINGLGLMTPKDISSLFQGSTFIELLKEAGLNMVDFSMKVGCFPSKSDALRIISAGGFHINQQKIKNPSEILNENVHMLKNSVTLVRVGKKNYYVVRWV